MYYTAHMLNTRAFGRMQSTSSNGSWCFGIGVWWINLESPTAWNTQYRRLCPTTSMLECHPCVTLHQTILFQLLCCHGKQLLAVYKPMKIVTNVCDTNMHWTPPEIDFESVTFPEKIGVREHQVAIYCLILNVSIHSVVGCVINVTDETCCALGSILWQIWPNNSLSNVKKTGLPPLVKYKH